MAEEVVTLTDDAGATARATAEVVRYGSGERSLRAAAYVVAGLVGGAACIIIPVLHLITTWGLPLLGIVLGVRAYRTETKVMAIAGPCPGCRETIQLNGGLPEEVRRSECPQCRAALEVRLEVDAAGPAETAGAAKQGSDA